VKLAFISPLVFEISQLQSAQDRVVLACTNAINVRCEHYELVAMRGGGGQKLLRWIAALPLRKFIFNFEGMALRSSMANKVMPIAKGN
jgi:hypothetical protein